jgi:hypothetical protein
LVSMQVAGLPHIIWPATAQRHWPPWQVAPPMHLLPHAPQLFMSVVSVAQTPPEHCMVPLGHDIEHAPFAQTFVPVHLLPQLPQLLVVVLSTQLLLHKIWLAPLQVQALFTQLAPPVQAFPQLPQSAELLGPLHAPSEHFVPELQVDEQLPLLSQTSLPLHAEQLEPQCCAFEATHCPPQRTLPLVQVQVPF